MELTLWKTIHLHCLQETILKIGHTMMRKMEQLKKMFSLVFLIDIHTVESRYLEVDWAIFYKFKLPEVQINLHFR